MLFFQWQFPGCGILLSSVWSLSMAFWIKDQLKHVVHFFLFIAKHQEQIPKLEDCFPIPDSCKIVFQFQVLRRLFLISESLQDCFGSRFSQDFFLILKCLPCVYFLSHELIEMITTHVQVLYRFSNFVGIQSLSISRVKKLRESEGRNLTTVINWDLSHFKTNRMNAMQEPTVKMPPPPKKKSNSQVSPKRSFSLFFSCNLWWSNASFDIYNPFLVAEIFWPLVFPENFLELQQIGTMQ